MVEANTKLLYGLEDKPPLGKAVVLGLQHVLTMFGSTVAVPLLLGPMMGLDTAGIALLISSVMLCSGVATLLQASFGSRLPIIQGVSFSFLSAFFGIIAAVHVEGAQVSPGAAMPYIAGAVIGGAVIEMIIGFSGLMGLVRRVLSPVVVGPVIMLIGLALFRNAGATVAASHWPIAILTMLLIVLCSFVFSRWSLVFRLFPMLLAIVTAVGVCVLLSLTGVLAPDSPARPDFSAFEQASWVRGGDLLFPWGLPRFSTPFFLAILAGYLASMIESFGDYHACKQVAAPDDHGGDPTPREISRGIGFEGVGCALTGVFGGFSSTSYSENVGLVGLTRVGSRYVVQLGAGMLILLGIFGKFGALAAAIPAPVVGGLYCIMFGLIAAVGVRQFARADLSSDRNLMVGGFALFMGLSLPWWFENAGAQQVSAALPASLADVFNTLGGNGMAVAAILGITLDNLIPATKAERGLEPRGEFTPSPLVPEADDVDAAEPAPPTAPADASRSPAE